MAKYKALEKELERTFKDVFKEMKPNEFEVYLKKLIDSYYSTYLTYEDNFNLYAKNVDEKYSMIKKAKSLVDFNNIDNFENYYRLVKCEEIAYKQMNELHFMEDSYTNMIYSNAVQELIFINETLSELINLYEKVPDQELLNLIVRRLKETIVIIREIKKLPLYEGNYKDYEVKVEFDKKYIKDLTPEEDKELPETIESINYKVPILSFDLKKQLEEFNKIIERIKEISDEENSYLISDFEFNLNLSERDYSLYMYSKSSKSKEFDESGLEIFRIIDFNHKAFKKESKYLYQIIYNNWD